MFAERKKDTWSDLEFIVENLLLLPSNYGEWAIQKKYLYIHVQYTPNICQSLTPLKPVLLKMGHLSNREVPTPLNPVHNTL